MSDIRQRLEANQVAAQGDKILSVFDDSDLLDAFSSETDGMLPDISKTYFERNALALLVDLGTWTCVAENAMRSFAKYPLAHGFDIQR